MGAHLKLNRRPIISAVVAAGATAVIASMPKPEPILCWLDGIEPFHHDRKHPRRPRRLVRLPPFVEVEMLSDDEVDELRRQVKENSAYYRKAFAHLRPEAHSSECQDNLRS
jgi:hypothetical protein